MTLTPTLGITGMDSRTEADLRAAFAIANAHAGERWALAGDDADVVVVDMDSLYGPMSWLRLHAAGKRVIGLTAMARTQADFRLPRPIDTVAFGALLEAIADGMPDANQTRKTVTASTEAAASTQAMPPAAAAHASRTDDPVSQSSTVMPATAPATAGMDAPVIDAPIVAEPVTPATERPLAAWIGPHGLDRRVRLQRDASPPLLLDVAAGHWHGDSALKPLTPYFEGTLSSAAFTTPTAADWDAEAALLGPAQPLARLHWLGGLVAGHGVARAGAGTTARFRLLKWPQTEREYPKHFRIATAMMKVPATIADIAEASGVGADEVADFINANLATGYAEMTTDVEATRPSPGGLLGRIRSR